MSTIGPLRLVCIWGALVRSILLLGALFLTACGGALHSQPPPQRWSTGFWFWGGSVPRIAKTIEPLDLIYVYAGYLQKGGGAPRSATWSVSASLPDELPPAREYWLVLRFNHQAVPERAAVPVIAGKIGELRNVAEQRRLNLVGIQLDIDSPTGSLAEYADFLRELRKALPAGLGVSITALLDWFREGTSVADVIEQVDEFVPQFYDVGAIMGPAARPAIAAKIDSARWDPIFNHFAKRFRIGISNFGRAIRLRDPTPKNGAPAHTFYADLVPADFTKYPRLHPFVTSNETNELVLTYHLPQESLYRTGPYSPGDTIQFIIPTVESVKGAVANARKIGGYCAGVLFFRWPALDETLVMDPGQVLEAAGIIPHQDSAPGLIQTVDGGCAAVYCMDLYLRNSDPLRAIPVRFTIHSSTGLEYFMPKEGLPIRMVGPSDLVLSLPPYGGRRSAYLGRAVAVARAQFTLQEEKAVQKKK